MPAELTRIKRARARVPHEYYRRFYRGAAREASKRDPSDCDLQSTALGRSIVRTPLTSVIVIVVIIPAKTAGMFVFHSCIATSILAARALIDIPA